MTETNGPRSESDMKVSTEERAKGVKAALTPDELNEFIEAFQDNTSGCRETCHCGLTYYDRYNSYDWGEGDGEEDEDGNRSGGELEWLEESDAIGLDHSVGTIQFEGRDYVSDCECWHARAAGIYGFIRSHSHQIASLINERRFRLIKGAASMPIVGDNVKGFTTMADRMIRRSVDIQKGSRVIALKDINLYGYGDSRQVVLCRGGDLLEIRDIRMEPDLFIVSKPDAERGGEFIMHRQELEHAIEKGKRPDRA